jgi:hypothetical protein
MAVEASNAITQGFVSANGHLMGKSGLFNMVKAHWYSGPA